MIKLLVALLISQSAIAGYVVKQKIKNNLVHVVAVEKANIASQEILKLKSLQEVIAEKELVEPVVYEEIYYPENKLPKKFHPFAFKKEAPLDNQLAWPGSEVREIVKSGSDSNRITITILGDGYTEGEKEKYFSDVKRMVKDMFQDITFKSYLSVFNIYAVFTPSEESGISDTQTRRTAFDLYRSPKNSKRGIMPGNRQAIEKALKLIPDYTDYPIIIANDDYYGGLGGRYAITTRSLTSGTMVLRHELGHNFSNVGEEYDGGQVYSGANFSRTKNVPWKHWMTGSKLEVHEAEFLTGAYIWQDLGTEDFSTQFDFPNKKGYTYDLKISSVGWASAQDVKVLLDGKELELNGVFTKDRSFFRTKRVPLSSGKHNIQILDNNRDGDNVLAYANGYAYPKSYNFTPDVVGAFNVFDNGQRQRGYRPMHNKCLMRDMRSKVFCPVDQENIWIRFLKRISLIDSVKEVNGKYELKTLDLSGLEIKWFKKNRNTRVELPKLSGQKLVDLKSLGKGKYEVEVAFNTPEIRLKSEVTTDTKEIKIK